MDLYNKNMFAVIDGMDDNELRGLLKEVETEIKRLVGSDPMDFFLRCNSKKYFPLYGQVEQLIKVRNRILDNMFHATPYEVKLLGELNRYIDKLGKQMYHRTADLYRTLLTHGREPEFDDDYVIEGTLQCNIDYDSESQSSDDVLKLDNDGYYGSDFTYMVPLVCYYEYERKGEYGRNIVDCSINYDKRHTPDMSDEEFGCYDSMYDGQSWADGCLRMEELKGICICYALYAICDHHEYSVPDVLRMNGFWIESKIVCQHITDRQGRRLAEIRAEWEKEDKE